MREMSIDRSGPQPLVTVGIPTYNRPEGLARTLECITGQTYGDLEIIVSDNCSPDSEVGMVVRAFQQRDDPIQYFRHPKNRGGLFNFRFVLERAAGEYFMWAADDDEWAKSYIETCLKALANGGGCSAFTSFLIKNRARNTVIESPLPMLSPTNSTFDNAYSYLNHMTPHYIYGLHKTWSVLFVLDDHWFDWYDCYFTLRLILDGGVVSILGQYLYVAGIDELERPPKPFEARADRVYTYHPFYLKCAQQVLRSAKLSGWQKTQLLLALTAFTAHAFCENEDMKRPLQVSMVATAMRVVNLPRRCTRRGLRIARELWPRSQHS